MVHTKEHMISVINEKGFNSRVNFWGKIDRDEIQILAE